VKLLVGVCLLLFSVLVKEATKTLVRLDRYPVVQIIGNGVHACILFCITDIMSTLKTVRHQS